LVALRNRDSAKAARWIKEDLKEAKNLYFLGASFLQE
jgi:hypothetical protein